MTDEQRVGLIREIVVQLMTDRLTENQALTAIAYVLDTSEGYERAALAVRLGTADLGD